MPILKLSQTPRNKNKVSLCCPKNVDARCKYFHWIHEAPKPVYSPRTATRSALKKRLNDMVHPIALRSPQEQRRSHGFVPKLVVLLRNMAGLPIQSPALSPALLSDQEAHPGFLQWEPFPVF